MSVTFTNIQEQRFALLELNSLMIHIKKEYGNNPPIDILNTIAEVAKAYRLKYANSSGSNKENKEIQNFCTKNGLASI